MNSPNKLALLGSKISKSKAAIIHANFAKQFNIIVDYQLIEIESQFSEQLTYIRSNNWKGANVTAPYKIKALNYANKITPEAKHAGSTNTLKFQSDGSCIAHNTDGAGFASDLANNLKWELNNLDILILGAGGAARGILPYIFDAKPKEVTIVNRSKSKAECLAKQYLGLKVLSYDQFISNHPYDLIINATSASLQNLLPPIPNFIMTKYTYCYDLAYTDKETPFVSWAKANGSTHVSDGLRMAIEQAAFGFEFWFDLKPNTKPLIEMLVVD